MEENAEKGGRSSGGMQPQSELADSKKNYTLAKEGVKSRIQVLLASKAFYITCVENIPTFPETGQAIWAGKPNAQKGCQMSFRHDNVEVTFNTAKTIAGWETPDWLADKILGVV